MSEYQNICPAADIPEGAAKMILLGERRLAVFHVQGSYHVLDDACPHAGASLARGEIEGPTVRCRIHYWQFRLCDGCALDPVGTQWNVRAYPARVIDGYVQARLD